jgi:hypothetical protein
LSTKNNIEGGKDCALNHKYAMHQGAHTRENRILIIKMLLLLLAHTLLSQSTRTQPFAATSLSRFAVNMFEVNGGGRQNTKMLTRMRMIIFLGVGKRE